MLKSTSAKETCQEVLQTLRSSSLIFILQETAYSAYNTIRKRYRKEALKNSVHSPSDCTENEALKSLELVHNNLVRSYNNLKRNFEETALCYHCLHELAPQKSKCLVSLRNAHMASFLHK